MGYKEIVKQKDYMKIVSASVVNRFGDSVDAIASTWIVYEITGNATWSAIIYAMNMLPTVFVTPLAGAFVEQRSKKWIMVITDIIRALCVAFIATGYLTGFLEGWHILITTFLISVAEAFRGPASAALTPLVLKPEYYDYGMSLSMSLTSIVELIGMGAAAGIIAIIGSAGAIYVDMGTFLISALIITTVKVKESLRKEAKEKKSSYGKELKEGFGYLIKLKPLIIVCILAMFLNGVLVPLNSLQAPLVGEILHGNSGILSVLGLSFSLSMLFGTITYPKLVKYLNLKRLIVMVGLAAALFYMGVVACKPLYVYAWGAYAVIILFSAILGYIIAVTNAYFSVAFMKLVDQDYMARCQGIFTGLIVAVNPITAFLVSVLTGFASTEAVFLISGAFAILFIIGILFNKTIKNV